MNANNKKYGLGRGLEALLGDDDLNLNLDDMDNDVTSFVENAVFKVDGYENIKIDEIIPCEFQPRSEFNEEALNNLSESIKEKGVLQPLLVRKKDEKYEIIAGERRWRAAKLAGLEVVPAVIKDFDDCETLEIALIENLQRENLSAIEEAEGFNRLVSEHGYTQDVLGKVIGKSRSHIANTLRLLLLPEDVKELVKQGLISAGHARAIIGNERASAIAKEIVEKGLSVRDVEKMIADMKRKKENPIRNKVIDTDLEQIIRDLENRLKLKVKINAGKKGKGSITLQYRNPAELNAILDLLEQR